MQKWEPAFQILDANRVQARSSQRASEVEIGERETPKAVSIKTPVAFIQAHKFDGVRCACDRLQRGRAISHGQGQDYPQANEDCSKDERQQLHERFPRRGKYRL
jgi:hypothetical protein